MQGGFNRDNSLQELEHEDWGEPTYLSYLVTTCHRLHRKPLNQFTVEDLRIMIGQGFSLPYLIPLAVERLEASPLANGDYYPGDLLAMVLKIEKQFWLSHPESLQRVRRVLRQVRANLMSLDAADRRTAEGILEHASEQLTSE